jgi:serine/threonine protein kinase
VFPFQRFRFVYKILTLFLFKIKLGSREEARDGINRTALREIKLLQELKHDHIIGLLDVFGHRSNVSLVFDFMDTDLEQIIKDTTIILTPAHIKAYILMTLQGLEYLHLLFILHRVIIIIYFFSLYIMTEVCTFFLSTTILGSETKQSSC